MRSSGVSGFMAWVALTVLGTGCVVPQKPPVASAPPAEATPGNPVRAFTIDADPQLMQGELAVGQLGDTRLENDQVAVIIRKPGGDLGGQIIDAGTKESSRDELEAYLAYGDHAAKRQAVYTELAIVDDGRSGRPAAVEVRGHDSEDEDLSVTTRYTLAPGSHVVHIHTEVLNRGKHDYDKLEIRDSIDWGTAESGVTAHKGSTELGWVGAQGGGVSYAWLAHDGKAKIGQTDRWMEPTLTAADLSMGWKAEVDRSLAIGDGDVGSLLGVLLAEEALPTVTLRGKVRESGSKDPVSGASVAVYQTLAGAGDRLVMTLKADSIGNFSGAVAPGDYKLKPSARGRAAVGGPVVFHTSAKPADVSVTLSKKASITFLITDPGGAAIGARLDIQDVKGAAFEVGVDDDTLILGPSLASATGQGSLDVPPGRYMVRISRGPAFEMIDKRVTAQAGKVARLKVKLRPAFKMEGWEAMDYALASEASAGCDLSPDQQLIRAVAEGVTVAVGGDRRAPLDLRTAAGSLGIRQDVATITGLAVDAAGVGEFVVFPVASESVWTPWPVAKGMAPGAMFKGLRTAAKDKTLIVATAPMSSRGYLSAMAFNPDSVAGISPTMSWDFNALEVFGGAKSEDADLALRAWYRMLDQGRRVVAVGSNHTCTRRAGPPGYPRTWVKFETTNLPGASLVKAMGKRPAVFVSNGPFVEVTLGGAEMGGELVAQPGQRGDISVKVSAASWIKLGQVDLIHNGEVVKTWTKLRNRGARLTAKHRVDLGDTGWYVVKVTGTSAMTPLSDQTPFAITNPIWVVEAPPEPPKPAAKPAPPKEDPGAPKGAGKATPKGAKTTPKPAKTVKPAKTAPKPAKTTPKPAKNTSKDSKPASKGKKKGKKTPPKAKETPDFNAGGLLTPPPTPPD